MTKHLGTEAKGTRSTAPCVAEASDTSKTAKHWHAPWSFGSHSIEDANGRRVVDIDGGPPMQAANARLIAAAPEMLAALIEIINACDICGKDDDLSLIDTFTEEMENRARAAIAKATGAAQ